MRLYQCWELYMRNRLRGLALVCLVSITSVGCFLQVTIGREIIEDVSDFVDAVFTAIDTHATLGLCTTIGGTVSCQYFVNGVPITSTASMASELGLILGAIADPMIVELPAAAINIAGTYDDGAGHTGPLSVYPALSYVPVDDTHTLTPGPGRQLAIFDLPAGAPIAGVTYHFGLTFQQFVPDGTGPTQVKALMSAKVTQSGKTFYPPMLPCVSDFSALPSITIPRSAVLEPLTLPAGVPCVNKFYGYFRNEVGPSMACDLDNDHDIDRNDVALIMAVRNRAASPGDPRDINADRFINANDARACTLQCTKAQCNP